MYLNIVNVTICLDHFFFILSNSICYLGERERIPAASPTKVKQRVLVEAD